MDENDLNSPQMRDVISIVTEIRRAKSYYAAGLPRYFHQAKAASLYQIGDPATGQGQGVFAKRFIKAGTRIICGKPDMIVPKSGSGGSSFGDIFPAFQALSPANKARFLALPSSAATIRGIRDRTTYYAASLEARKYLDEITDLHSKWARNAQNFAPYPGEALNLDFAHVKHACLPNILPFNDGEGVFTVLVLKDIAAGEEFTRTKVGPLGTLSQRRNELADLDITCSCPACDMTTAFSREFEIRQCKIQRLATATGTAGRLQIAKVAPSLAGYPQGSDGEQSADVSGHGPSGPVVAGEGFPSSELQAGRRSTREAWVQRYKWDMERARMDLFVYPPGHKQYEGGKRFMAMYNMQMAKDAASRKA
ncbi:hypothetical protein BU16DRAFT_565312 [Lophium mytilinum]|uniref:SET domain-containing protein n=1 Tax=Lophium mytilinum TaxID=390894 RepID=A0A6A6QIX4_9PEZI|nr:hypothetical protein BU16DRAFT_565312 [Lophium mytilinum]